MLINKQGERGFSLIEIIVTTAIMSIIAWMLSSYMNRAKRLEAEQTSIDAAQQTKKYLADLIRRDLSYVVDPTQVQPISVHDIKITRTKSQPTNHPDPSQVYQVQISARCTAIPSALQAQMAAIDFASLSSSMQKKASCTPTATLKCGPGSYPQLVIQPDAGTNIPVYQRKIIPNLTSNTPIFQTPVGVLPCFQLNGKQLTLSLDVFYLRNAATVNLDLVGEKYFMLVGAPTDISIFQQ